MRNNTVLQLTRLDYENRISIVRKTNKKARLLREKLESSILSEIGKNTNIMPSYGSSFYLMYNEFGVKKKCFSNLSQLKIGLSENRDLMPDLLVKLPAYSS